MGKNVYIYVTWVCGCACDAELYCSVYTWYHVLHLYLKLWARCNNAQIQQQLEGVLYADPLVQFYTNHAGYCGQTEQMLLVALNCSVKTLQNLLCIDFICSALTVSPAVHPCRWIREQRSHLTHLTLGVRAVATRWLCPPL